MRPVTTNDSLKSHEQILVEKFMARMNHPMQPLPTSPEMPNLEVKKLRAKLMLEEVIEIIELGFGLHITFDPNGNYLFNETGPGDLREIAGNLADLDVVGALGTAAVCGIAMKPIIAAVNGNNLLKFAPGHSFRTDGKLVKPPDHPKIEDHIGELLRAQGWQG